MKGRLKICQRISDWKETR